MGQCWQKVIKKERGEMAVIFVSYPERTTVQRWKSWQKPQKQTYQIVNITNSGPSLFYLLKINPFQVCFSVVGILLAGEFRLESVFQQASTYSNLILTAFK